MCKICILTLSPLQCERTPRYDWTDCSKNFRSTSPLSTATFKKDIFFRSLVFACVRNTLRYGKRTYPRKSTPLYIFRMTILRGWTSRKRLSLQKICIFCKWSSRYSLEFETIPKSSLSQRTAKARTWWWKLRPRSPKSSWMSLVFFQEKKFWESWNKRAAVLLLNMLIQRNRVPNYLNLWTLSKMVCLMWWKKINNIGWLASTIS